MLTEEEARLAEGLGWQLCFVYCPQKEKLLLSVLPAGPAHRNAEDAMKGVVWLAKHQNPVAIRALMLISQFNAGKKK